MQGFFNACCNAELSFLRRKLFQARQIPVFDLLAQLTAAVQVSTVPRHALRLALFCHL
jgi:hypothetical protein